MNNEIQKELKEIFSLVNMWLNFAEAKNAIILSVFCGITYTFFEEINEINIYLSLFIYFILFCGLFASLISFYPNLTNSKLKGINATFIFMANCFKEDKNSGTPEIIKLFYTDIAKNYVKDGKPNYEDYLKDISKGYFENPIDKFSELEKDYAKEIIINSQITTNKYQLFKASLRMLIIFTILIFGLNIFKKISENHYYITVTPNVILREFPSTESIPKKVLLKNQMVKKIDSQNDWIKVTYDSEEGWIYKSLLLKK